MLALLHELKPDSKSKKLYSYFLTQHPSVSSESVALVTNGAIVIYKSALRNQAIMHSSSSACNQPCFAPRVININPDHPEHSDKKVSKNPEKTFFTQIYQTGEVLLKEVSKTNARKVITATSVTSAVMLATVSKGDPKTVVLPLFLGMYGAILFLLNQIDSKDTQTKSELPRGFR